jgi:hypothetical protein
MVLHQAPKRWYGCACKTRTPLALSNWVNGVSIWQTSWTRSSTKMLALCFFCTFIKFSGEIHIILWISLVICYAPFLWETVGQSSRLELKYVGCMVLYSSWRGLYQFYDFFTFFLLLLFFRFLCTLKFHSELITSSTRPWGYQFPILSGHIIKLIFLYYIFF